MLEPVKLLNNASFSSKNVPSNSFLMGQPGLFYRLFSVFSSKHHYDFYNKYM